MNIGKKEWARIFLRTGLAFVFLYAAIASFLDPFSWAGYLPGFFQGEIRFTMLNIFSFYEIILGLWLISGYRLIIPASLSALTMIGILVTNIGAGDIVFRNVGVLGGALALAVLTYQGKSKQ